MWEALTDFARLIVGAVLIAFALGYFAPAWDGIGSAGSA
jgi:hypothetical protein